LRNSEIKSPGPATGTTPQREFTLNFNYYKPQERGLRRGSVFSSRFLLFPDFRFYSHHPSQLASLLFLDRVVGDSDKLLYTETSESSQKSEKIRQKRVAQESDDCQLKNWEETCLFAGSTLRGRNKRQVKRSKHTKEQHSYP
jgi:hypothetical protein